MIGLLMIIILDMMRSFWIYEKNLQVSCDKKCILPKMIEAGVAGGIEE
jgi:hypothetical protein